MASPLDLSANNKYSTLSNIGMSIKYFFFISKALCTVCIHRSDDNGRGMWPTAVNYM